MPVNSEFAPQGHRLSEDEIYDQLPEYCIFNDELASAVVQALALLDANVAQKILDRTFFILFEGGSRHFSREVIGDREIVLLDPKDLATEQESIVTILHECGHVFLEHASLLLDSETYQKQEDECWDLVRNWLPQKFKPTIDTMEREGGGNNSTLDGE